MLVGSRVFANMMSSVLPEDTVNEIVSFHGTEYDKYRHRYTWDEIDEMVYELMTTGPDFCCYLFSILSEIGDDLYIFYPNAKDDPKVMRKTGWYVGDVNVVHAHGKAGVSFDRFDWFMADFFQSQGKRWYLCDENTNYDGMVFMITQILNRFDKWYLDSFTGRSDNQVHMVEVIVRVYATLEKYYAMTNDEIYACGDIPRASPYL